MVSQPRAGALSNKRTIKETLEGDQFRQAVAKVLPKHLTPDRFVRVAIMAMTRTPKLAQCEPASFFQCLMSLSQYGLEPDGRRAHLIPFENRKRKCVECQLIIDYKGLAELVLRSGIVSYLHADVVCDNDDFEYDRGLVVRHKINLRGERGNVYAAYAICRFKDGSEKCDVMSKSDVERIRNRSRAAQSGPWVTDWNEMAKKTVFRRLSKWLPLSPEVRDAIDSEDESEARRAESAKPVFEAPGGEKPALFELPESAEESPEFTDPSEGTDLGPSEPEKAETKGGFNLPKALRGLCKLGNIDEVALLAYLRRTQGLDDSLSSLEECCMVAPEKMRAVNDNWATVSKEIGQAKEVK